MKTTLRFPLAPAGSYKKVPFAGMRPVAASQNVFGKPAQVAEFFVDINGKKFAIERMFGFDARENSVLGDFLNDLFGREIEAGEEVDPDTCKGKLYDLVVSKDADGKVSLDSITLSE